MTSFQKIIKYGAIAFGIYLSCMIIGMILFGLTMLFGISVGMDSYQQNIATHVQEMTPNDSKEFTNVSDITKIDIDVKMCKLYILTGDTLKVETTSQNSSDFECKVTNHTLKIKDKKIRDIFWFQGGDNTPVVTIYLPETIEFEKIKINLGAADTRIEQLNSKDFDIDTGAGRCTIQKLIAKEAKINCGAGETIVEEATIENLRLDGGIGRTVITSAITNHATIHSGIGKLDINLQGNQEEYQIRTKTGLGNFIVDGHSVQDNQVIGNGDSTIKVEAGIGETRVNFTE